MFYARIENKIVKEILEIDNLPPFHKSLKWIKCDGNTGEGFIDNEDGTFTEPDAIPDPPYEPSELYVRLAALEKKAGITQADKDAARTALKNVT